MYDITENFLRYVVLSLMKNIFYLEWQKNYMK